MRRSIVVFLALVGVYLLVFLYFAPISQNDPDRFYHLALARQTAEHGLVKKLPQAADLRWADQFSDKNFLFTAITAVAYRAGGEAFVLAIVPVFAISLLAVLFGLLCCYVSPFWALALTAPMLLTPDFANRVTLLRPHLLALVSLAVFWAGTLRNRRAVAGLGIFLFILSYHALYVAGALVVLAFLLGYRRSAIPAAVAGIVGIFVHPYFPQNLGMAGTTLSIALNWNRLRDADRPLENVALPFTAFIVEYFPYLVALVVGMSLLYRYRRQAIGVKEVQLSFAGALLFWGLSLVTRRAAEIAIPLSVIAVGVAVSHLPANRSRAILAGLIVWLALPLGFAFYSRDRQPMDQPLYALEAVRSLPTEKAGEKVFNCEWHNGPYLLYLRPDLKFVDLSDPSLLYDAKPDLYRLREKIRSGEVENLYAALTQDFNAQFVLCEKRSVISRLEQDRRFERLYPREITDREWATWKPFLYRVAKTPNPRQPSP